MKLALALGALLCVRPAIAQNGTLALLGGNGSCNVVTNSEGRATFYVVVVPDHDDFDCCGAAVVEFRIDGLPSGWGAFMTPARFVQMTIGNLFVGGATIYFSQFQCLFPSLTFCAVTLTEVVGTATLTARGRPPAVSPRFNRQGVCLGWEGLDGGTLRVNAPCTVQAETKTWGALKALYH